jgi:hypothetical protein
MKKYWFYGIMPRDSISEDRLTEKQKDIIVEESNNLTSENFSFGWLGFQRGDKWEFMRHGVESIFIEEERGNVAREKFVKILNEKYIL